MRKGEKIRIRLHGSERYDLTQIDFTVYVYPCGAPETTFKKTKADCEARSGGIYICEFTAEETREFPAGIYALEIHDSTNDAIFVKARQFSIGLSASALEEPEVPDPEPTGDE